MSGIGGSSSGDTTSGSVSCPACGGRLRAKPDRCPACGFSAARLAEWFPEAPPPLPPIFDAAGILSAEEMRRIEAGRDRLGRRFPQFQWRICTVMLPPETGLPLFGFWLLNACPLNGAETAEQRASTVLLLIDSRSGKAAAIPGYAVESFLSDDCLTPILATMAGPWLGGNPVEAILEFFSGIRRHLDRAWKLESAKPQEGRAR